MKLKKEIMVGLGVIMMVSLIIGIVMSGVQYEGMTELPSIPQEKIDAKTMDDAKNQADKTIKELEIHIKDVENPIKQILNTIL